MYIFICVTYTFLTYVMNFPDLNGNKFIPISKKFDTMSTYV